MFNFNNCIWSMYGDDALRIQGWFMSPPVTQETDERHWLHVFAEEIAGCSNEEEIVELLTTIESHIGFVSLR